MKNCLVLLSALAAKSFAAPAVELEARHDPRHDGRYWGGKGGYGDGSNGPNDYQILNYALTLEHLEDTFYRQGLANFTEADFENAGYGATFYNNLKEVSMDESTHVTFLTSALQAAGQPAVAECTYNFGALTPKTFVATASVLEGVGVSAYLGAAQYISSKAYLTAAGSILTVESRHSSYLRSRLNESPFPAPFDTPLDFNEVYTLAAAFIVSCPASNPPLPVKAFPSIATSPAGPYRRGQNIMFQPGQGFNVNRNTQLYAAFITVTGPIFTQAEYENGAYEVTIPLGVAGQVYAVLTTNHDMVADSNIVAGPALMEVSTPYFD